MDGSEHAVPVLSQKAAGALEVDHQKMLQPAQRRRLHRSSVLETDYFFFEDFFAEDFFLPPAFFFAATEVTSFLFRFSRSAACTPPPITRERHGSRGRAGAGEAGYRKQGGEREMRGATRRRHQPSGVMWPCDDLRRRRPCSFVSVSLLQLAALTVASVIRARHGAHYLRP